MRWAIAVLACATGCDLVFPPGKGPGVTADAPGDDVADDAAGDRDGSITDAAPTVDAAFACPPQYTSSRPPSYGLHTDTVTWDTAIGTCLLDQVTVPGSSPAKVHLVVIDDDSERHDLVALFGDRTLWVGASDRRDEGNFWTVTTQPDGYPPSEVGAPWGTGQPDDDNTGQDCLLLMGPIDPDPGLLDDLDCTAFHEFVCECDAFADDPGKY